MRNAGSGAGDDGGAGVLAIVATDALPGAALISAGVHQGAFVKDGHGVVETDGSLVAAEEFADEAVVGIARGVAKTKG